MRLWQNIYGTIRTTLVLTLALCTPLVVSADTAASPFKWHGEGEEIQMDTANFTDEQRKRYEVFDAMQSVPHTEASGSSCRNWSLTNQQQAVSA